MNVAWNSISPRPISVLLAMPELEQGIACRNGLAARSCIVNLVHDGSEVLEALRRYRPDVILLDAVIAAQHRIAIFGAIESRSANKSIPVIILASNGVVQNQVMRFGADAAVLASNPAQALYRTIVGCLSRVPCAA